MKTIRIEPLTRVEGHGRVLLQLQKGRLAGAQVEITESPRLFERMVVGRSLGEVPALVSRICAICASAHRINAARALERALKVEVPPAARRVRELLLLGGHIESHALHLFCLILPDLAGTPSLLELLRAGDEGAREGLALKALGNRIQAVAGGRTIHPINVEVGGIVQFPPRESLGELQGELARWEERLPRILEPFGNPENFPPGSDAVGVRLAVAPGGGFSLLGDFLQLSDGTRVPVSDYRNLLQEMPVAQSNAQRSLREGAPLLTGALSRLDIARGAGHPLEGEETVGTSIYGNNGAQAAELAWALSRSRALVEKLLEVGEVDEVRASVRPGAGVGTAALEAPRGLLVHHYVLDDLGRVAEADIVTPTAINQAAMEAQLLADLRGEEDETRLAATAEQIVRAYDPCISCSVHVVKAGAGG